MNTHMPSETLLQYQLIIKNTPGFRQAIKTHYNINHKTYNSHPFFYKKILQESRFTIALAICCLIFSNQSTSISEIKDICLRYKIASPNSVIAIIEILRATNRIQTIRSVSDRRKILIIPTQAGLDDLKQFMASAFFPLSQLYPDIDFSVEQFENDDFRYAFFRQAAEYLFCGVIFTSLLPEAAIFIDKDGGRMIMLYLYLQAVHRNGGQSKFIGYSATLLSRKFHVSRIHVSRIMKSAEEAGYFKESKRGLIEVSPTFIELVENYVALYFAYVTHYLGIHPLKGGIRFPDPRR